MPFREESCSTIFCKLYLDSTSQLTWLSGRLRPCSHHLTELGVINSRISRMQSSNFNRRYHYSCESSCICEHAWLWLRVKHSLHMRPTIEDAHENASYSTTPISTIFTSYIYERKKFSPCCTLANEIKYQNYDCFCLPNQFCRGKEVSVLPFQKKRRLGSSIRWRTNTPRSQGLCRPQMYFPQQLTQVRISLTKLFLLSHFDTRQSWILCNIHTVYWLVLGRMAWF